MRVLVTRAEPAASKTAEKLLTNELDPLVFPLFEVCDTGTMIPKDTYNGTILTSSNAVQILDHRGWKPEPENKSAYCVGRRTADEAGNLGFENIVFAEGGGKALVPKIISENHHEIGKLLYPAPIDRAFDMATALEREGISVSVVEVYEHRKITPYKAERQSRRADLADGFVMAFSERSAQHTAKMLFDLADYEAEDRPSLVAISRNTAESVLNYPWAGVYVAEKPNEASMIAKIMDIIQR